MPHDHYLEKSAEPPQSPTGDLGPGARPAGSVWSSSDLLAGRRETLIEHRGEIYRLRETRNGKLILQK